ncbi:MAG: hypothetical protein ACWA6X_10435 [Bauldia sp.]
MTRTISARRASPRMLALCGTFLAALTLAACGDDTDDAVTTTTPTLETAQPAMQATPPAMEAAPPAMEAAPPAMAAAPAGAVATTLALANLVGGWATDLAACATPGEVTTITLTNVTGGGLTRTVTSAGAGANGLDVVLAGTVDNAPVTETWTFTAAGTTPPLTSVNVVMGGEAAMTWVRCPAPAP